jgi:hypothetical protein
MKISLEIKSRRTTKQSEKHFIHRNWHDWRSVISATDEVRMTWNYARYIRGDARTGK